MSAKPQTAPQMANVESYERRAPKAKVTIRGRDLLYTTPNRTCLWRVRTLTTKEPSTIAWLDSLTAKSVLLDIGANVGLYTIYAAVVSGARVFAFEPEAQNYALLCRNIMLNKVSDRVVAWSAALSDRSGFDRLFLSSNESGGSCHAYGEARDSFLRAVRFPFVQGSYATTVDALVADAVVPTPSAIKIDVDGFEHRVVRGAAETLRSPELTSVLVEINPHIAEHRWIVEHLQSLGFVYDAEQVAAARRKDGPFQGLGEYVFRR